MKIKSSTIRSKSTTKFLGGSCIFMSSSRYSLNNQICKSCKQVYRHNQNQPINFIVVIELNHMLFYLEPLFIIWVHLIIIIRNILYKIGISHAHTTSEKYIHTIHNRLASFMSSSCDALMLYKFQCITFLILLSYRRLNA